MKTLLLFVLAGSLAIACSSIGNQHFYGLEPALHAPIDREVYRVPRVWEHSAYEEGPKTEHIKASSLVTIDREAGFIQVYEVGLEEWLNASPLDALIRLDLGSRVHSHEQGASTEAEPTSETSDAEQNEHDDEDDECTPTEPRLDESDQILVSFPDQYFVPHFQRGVIHLRDDAYFEFSVLETDKYSDDRHRRTALIRLTRTIPRAEAKARYAELPQLSFRPVDATFPLHAIAPTLNPEDRSQRIGPGMPLSLVANRLYLGDNGEVLGTGEIAGVVTVSEGGGAQQTFVAFHHEGMSECTFVPNWGSILYSTESWSGDPITIKVQVFDLDGTENMVLESLLGTAVDAVNQGHPAARAATGIAGALGKLLIQQNTDDEIIRFEFTFVYDADWKSDGTGTLVPYDRSYILIRPDGPNVRIPPESIKVDDQWTAQKGITPQSWYDFDSPISDRGVELHDSYLTFTVSSTIWVPAALMEKRKQEFDLLVDTRQVARLAPQERVEAARQAARSMASAVEYAPLFQEVTRLASQENYEELLVLAEHLSEDAAKASNEAQLIDADRAALLASLKRQLRDKLKGVTDWAGALTALEVLAHPNDSDSEEPEPNAGEVQDPPAEDG